MSGNETESERLDRKLIELLNELRVALPGIQVLFAFLLTLPFSSGFAKTTDFQRDLYAVSLVCAVLASIFLIAPSSYHRHRFHHLDHETVEDKREMITTQDHLAIAGFFFFTLSVLGSTYVVIDTLFPTRTTVIVIVVLGLGFAWFWYALPLSRRMRASRGDRGSTHP
jgi:hypothetical protein